MLWVILLSNFEEIVVFGEKKFEETVVFGEKNFEETEFFEWKVLIINKMCPVALPDFFSEREDAGEGHAEMLEPQRNADDADAEYETAEQMDDRNLPPAAQYPQEIHHHRETARLVRAVHQLMSEWMQGICAKLEQLQPERNADDSDAHQQPHDEIDYGDHKSAQHQPDKISYYAHF